MRQVLLIESDKVLAVNLSKMLSKQGYSVDWQVNPQVALDNADSQLPDIIVTDLMLAGRGGIEFLYEFRSYPDWQDVPVVLYSSLSPEELKSVAGGFEHLNIAAYHYKVATNTAQLVESLATVLQPVKL